MQRFARLAMVLGTAVALTMGAASSVTVVAAAEPDQQAAPGLVAVPAVVVAPAMAAHLVEDDPRALLRALRATPGRVVAEVVEAPPAPEPAPKPAPPAPEPAAQPSPPTEPHHVVVGREALARLDLVDLAAMGWRVDFHPGRDGYLGMADQHRRVIDIYVRDGHSVTQVLATLAHEAAHALDYEVWTDDIRKDWMRMRGIRSSWWPSCACEDRGYGAGDIAEALAVLEAGPGVWHGHYAQPTEAQLRWLLNLLA